MAITDTIKDLMRQEPLENLEDQSPPAAPAEEPSPEWTVALLRQIVVELRKYPRQTVREVAGIVGVPSNWVRVVEQCRREVIAELAAEE